MKKNTFNRICAAILAIVTVFLLIPVGMLPTFAEEPKIWAGTAAAGFAGGTGSEAKPYLIKTAEQLAYLAKTVNDGTTYEGKYFELGNDIVLNDTSNWENWGTTAPKNTWTAIGGYSDSSEYPFSGTFDGDGHTVSGIYVYTEADFQGLFGYANNAAIKNLGVKKSYIKGGEAVGGVVGGGYGTVSNCYNTGTVSGYDFVGGVVGAIGNGMVSDCYNTGEVSGVAEVGGVVGGNASTVSNCYNTGTVSGGDDVGGVVGYNYNGTVSDCYNTGAVSGNECVGGVVGYNYDGSTVSDCYNTGTVSGNEFVGGVVGYNYDGSTVINCYNTGAVSGGDSVGGVVGENYDGTVSNCYNTGTVSGDDYVGGVVGYIDYNGTVSNCYNTGEVIGEGYNVGGVVGRSYNGAVINCYNTGEVSGSDNYVGGVVGRSYNGAVSNCYNTGTVSGYYYAGGVVGENYNGTVSNCYNTGEVSGGGTVGGVAGNNNGTVTNCYNTGTVSGGGGVGGVVGYNYSDGTVTNCYNTGNVTGNVTGNYVGGVVGYNYGTATITNCYNTGNVTGDSVGGVVGYIYGDGTVTNCYYLTDCAKDGKGASQFGIGNTTKDISGQTTELTDVQMKKKENFVGFDFDKVWGIGLTLGYDYPTLHLYVAVVTAPTCTEMGYTTYTCECGKTYKDYTDSLGHDYEWVIDKKATKKESGLKHKECTRCHDKTDVNTVIPILTCDHKNAQKVAGKAATCTETGLKEYWHCPDCEKNFSDSACKNEISGNLDTWCVIDKLGHNYVAVVTPPTETERGYTTHTCSRCHDSYVDSYTDPIPAVTYGDINGDDTIDAFDYQMLKAFVLGTFKDVTNEQKEAMDVNYDGCADAFDYQMVKAHVLGTYVIQ